MKKFGILLALVIALPMFAGAAQVSRAQSSGNLTATTSSYTGLSNRNIFTTYHDQAQVNSDQSNLNDDLKQLNTDINNGAAQNVAADRNQIASDRVKKSGDFNTYNSQNNTGSYTGINTPIAVTHTDSYHTNSYRHRHIDNNNQ